MATTEEKLTEFQRVSAKEFLARQITIKGTTPPDSGVVAPKATQYFNTATNLRYENVGDVSNSVWELVGGSSTGQSDIIFDGTSSVGVTKIGQVVYKDGTTWKLAQANASETSNSLGIVSSFTTSSDFQVMHLGKLLLPDGIVDFTSTISDIEINDTTVQLSDVRDLVGGSTIQIGGNNYVIASSGVNYTTGIITLTTPMTTEHTMGTSVNLMLSSNGIWYISEHNAGMMTEQVASVSNWSKAVLISDTITSGYVVDRSAIEQVNNDEQLEEARCLFDSNCALSGLLSSDGITTAVGDRVLVMGQTDPIENGVWVVATGSWNRADDCSNGTHIGMKILFVTEGDLGGGSGWFCNAVAPADVVGTHSLYFTQFSVGDSGVAMESSDTTVLDIEALFNTAKTKCYAVPTRATNGRLTGWGVWDTPAKLVPLFTQTRTFGTSGVELDRMVTKVTTDLTRSKKLTETRTYVEHNTGTEILILLGTKTKTLEDS